MIATAQAIMKIISKISLTRMKLMVQNTQTVRKKLLPTDQNMNINHFQGLSKACLCFLIKRRVAILPFSNSNYLTKKKLSTQSSRELLIPLLFIFIFFSLHLFKNYGNSNKCVDVEVTYFLECTSMAQAGRLDTEAICKASRKQFILKVYDKDRCMS